VEAGHSTVAEAVDRFPEYADLADLVTLAQAISSVATPSPSPARVPTWRFASAHAEDDATEDSGTDEEDDTLALALDECLALLQHGEATPAQAAARHPEHAEMEDLLVLAQALRNLPQPERASPRPLHAWLPAEAATKTEQAPPLPVAGRRLHMLPRREALVHLARRPGLRAAMALAPLMLAWSTIAPAAQASGPGEPLYPIKRLWEQVELAIATDDIARAQVRLSLVERRMQEASSITVDARMREGLLMEAMSEVQYLRKAAARVPEAVTQEVTTRVEELRRRGVDAERAQPGPRERPTSTPRPIPTAAPPAEDALPDRMAFDPAEGTAPRSAARGTLARAPMPAAPQAPVVQESRTENRQQDTSAGARELPPPNAQPAAAPPTRQVAASRETQTSSKEKDRPEASNASAQPTPAQATAGPRQDSADPPPATPAIPPAAGGGRGPVAPAAAPAPRQPAAVPPPAATANEDEEEEDALAAYEAAAPDVQDTPPPRDASAPSEHTRAGRADERPEPSAIAAPHSQQALPDPKPQATGNARVEVLSARDGTPAERGTHDKANDAADTQSAAASKSRPADQAIPNADVPKDKVRTSHTKADEKPRAAPGSASAPERSSAPRPGAGKAAKPPGQPVKPQAAPPSQGSAKPANATSGRTNADSAKADARDETRKPNAAPSPSAGTKKEVPGQSAR
jgi:hypothetical protein